jgi:transcriptional regulator
MSLSLSDRQFEFWRLRRDGLANTRIAEQFRISRQAVSKALLTMEKKVEKTLLAMARANQIEVDRYNVEVGILFGRSVPFNAKAIVFVSAKHGVQVWYEHEGDCGSCPRYRECIELLWDFADELHIPLTKTDDPTRLADELFAKLRDMV